MHTHQERENNKSSKRLIEKQGQCKKIESIRLIITLKGINFLIENKKLKNDFVLSKWQKYWFWPIAIFAILGLAISIIALVSDK